jgi:hypothetical protein
MKEIFAQGTAEGGARRLAAWVEKRSFLRLSPGAECAK